MRVPTLARTVTLLLLVACADAITTPAPATPGPSARLIGDCENVDQACEGDGIVIIPGPFFGPMNDLLYEAPWDPSPGSAGIWLGGDVTPSTCFNDRTPWIADADSDWLDDHCELELAKGFAPRWSMGIQEKCGDGEPAWAAKYFPASGAVRLAFMPAYYDDCGVPAFGFGGGHHGDSELAMVEVGFNPGTQHWEFRQMWLSAHYDTAGQGAGDRSQWVNPADASFTRRYLGHPYIAVSANKHAMYKSDSKCNNTFAGENNEGDWCYSSQYTPFRFHIDPARNAGSRHRDLMGCVGSIKRFAGNGRAECFYTRQTFAGWNAGTAGQTPYSAILKSDKFENRFGDWGPGPMAYNASPTPDDPPPPITGCEDPRRIMCVDDPWAGWE